MFVPRKILEAKLLEFLAEDVGQGDVTTAAIVPAEASVVAEIIAKEQGIIAGIEETTILAESLGLNLDAKVADGNAVKNKQVVAKLNGNARDILTVERTMLNLLSRMSGIATATRNLAEKIRKANLTASIAATRKTAPGLLYFDKKAVQVGGGDPHRMHLDDLVLIKDNHITIAGSAEAAVKKARAGVSFTKKIEIEVTSPEEAARAAEAGADIVMLDNFSLKHIRQTVELMKKRGLSGRTFLEASGGITAENLIKYASTGVNMLSLGEITHSCRSLNLSLEITKVK